MSKHPSVGREQLGNYLKGNVKRLNERNYQVYSATSNKIYKIAVTSIGRVGLLMSRS